ncbi:MAG: hypothetical protein LBT67_01390, partial [Holosporaceae bacterium]|nr:hypothetical protein [Holosporaceae bacterium]
MNVKIIFTLFLLLLSLWLPATHGDGDVHNDSSCCTEQQFRQCTLANGIKVVLHEDFKMNRLLIGIVFHAGNLDAPPNKFGIVDVIVQNIIPLQTYKKLRELGVDCEVHSDNFCVQIMASINPRRLKDFLDAMCRIIPSISVRNLESYKKYAIAMQRLTSSFAGDAVENNIMAAIKFTNKCQQSFSSEKYLASIDAPEVENFYKIHFQKCPITIIACGAVGLKGLLKALRGSFSNLLPRRNYVAPEIQRTGSIYRDIRLENKYMSSGIIYGYLLNPEEDRLFGDIFSKLMGHEMFKYLKKMYPMANSSNIFDAVARSGCLKLVQLSPRSDVSLVSLDNVYRAFWKKICSAECSP